MGAHVPVDILEVRSILGTEFGLTEPDMQIARIRLSDKTFTPSPTARRAKPTQAYEPRLGKNVGLRQAVAAVAAEGIHCRVWERSCVALQPRAVRTGSRLPRRAQSFQAAPAKSLRQKAADEPQIIDPCGRRKHSFLTKVQRIFVQ